MSAIDVEQHGWTDKREYPSALHSNPKFVKSTSSSPIGQLPSPSSSKWPNSPGNVFDEKEFNHKIAEAKKERDLFWINHERTQLNIQREDCEKLMSKMHKEMERLHMTNRELERRLYVDQTGTEEIEELEKELSAERQMNADLRRELGLAVKRSAKLAQMLEKSTNIHKEQMALNESKTAELQEQIRRLNGLLLAKTKSRSIGPTMVRFGPVKVHRSLSGERGVIFATNNRVRTQSEISSSMAAIGQDESSSQALGIDVAQKNRPTTRRLMMFHSLSGVEKNPEFNG